MPSPVSSLVFPGLPYRSLIAPGRTTAASLVSLVFFSDNFTQNLGFSFLMLEVLFQSKVSGEYRRGSRGTTGEGPGSK